MQFENLKKIKTKYHLAYGLLKAEESLYLLTQYWVTKIVFNNIWIYVDYWYCIDAISSMIWITKL
jgi:hypothetical protein